MQGKNFTSVNFCERFQELLDASGKSQKELASEMELSEAALVNYKRDRLPKAEELLRIARFFRVSVDWLLTGEDESQPKSADGWQQRAIAAEAKVEMLKAGMQGLLKKI